MIHLPHTLAALHTPALEATLRRELEGLDQRSLPLQDALTRGSHVAEDPIGVMVIRVTEEPGYLRAKVGVAFRGIIAGCSCADDPTPVDTLPEYCELRVDIDKSTAEATLRLLAD